MIEPKPPPQALYDDVTFGEGCLIDVKPRGRDDVPPPAIGAGSTIRSHTVIYAGVVAGARFNTGHGSMIRENNVLGDDVSIGTNAVLEPGNRIGDRVRIHTGCFLENVTLGDDVFVGPNVVFTDDPHPMCPSYERCVLGATVGNFVSIGANSTILPGVKIGDGALIGAGSVVTRDVLPNTVVAGNPATFKKNVDDLTCFAGIYAKPYEWRNR
jgi:acetyltransferase-like isoleucine patch superfamily enzyme